MALLYSPANDSSFSLPNFQRPAVDGKSYGHSDFTNYEVTVFFFICNHCPYVKAIEDRMIQLYKTLKSKNIAFVAVCSNDPNDYPEDSFENIKKTWAEKNYDFPYLYDEDQSMAKDFGAVCTPDIFAFNSEKKLFYRGQLDDSWRDPNAVQREDLKIAIESEIHKKKLPFAPRSSMGCSIKWKS